MHGLALDHAAQLPDLGDELARLRIALGLVVDRLHGCPQGGELGEGGGRERQVPAAVDHLQGPFLLLLDAGEHRRQCLPACATQDLPLLRREPVERHAADDDRLRPCPEDDVRGHPAPTRRSRCS